MRHEMVVKGATGVVTRAFKGAASAVGKVKALATAAMLALVTAPALAGGGGSPAQDLGDAASTQLSGAQGVVLGILVTMIGIVFLFTCYKLIKRGGSG